jgi:hypothetical protein
MLRNTYYMMIAVVATPQNCVGQVSTLSGAAFFRGEVEERDFASFDFATLRSGCLP